MVAQPHDPAIRHNELLRAAQEIADLKQELIDMTNARNANKARADRAEAVNRQLEAQLKTDKREALTLIQDITMPEARALSDKEYADFRSQGWTPDNITISTAVGEVSTHYKRIVTLIRVAPLQPATDQPPITAAATVQESLTVPAAVAPTVPELATVQPVLETPLSVHGEGLGEGLIDPIAGLWNALYALGRFAELVQHWPLLPEYAPRVYAVFETAGCDMADVVIMKSFRPGRNNDEWTLKIIFRYSKQIATDIRKALAVAKFERVIARDGREFIFDLPQAWVSPSPRKTITASSMTIMENDTAQVIRQNIAEYEIPPYQTPPVGMTSDERIEYRLGQIRIADQKFINAFLGG